LFLCPHCGQERDAITSNNINMAQAKKEEGKKVEFLKNFRGYVKGDIAVFQGEDEKLAKELIKQDVAKKA
jgi:hypothetical protein